MRKGLNQWSVPVGTPIRDFLRQAAQSGFDGAELLYREDAELGPHLPLEASQEFANQARDLGLEILGFAAGALFEKYSLAHGTETEKRKARGIVEHAFETAKALGAGSILCVPGFVDSKQPYDQVYEKARTYLPEIARYAENYGVQVCIENIWNLFLLSPLEMRGLIDEMGSSHLRAYFDVGNILPFGFPEQWIRILGPRIGRVHVKDYRKAGAGLPGLVNLGEGDVDWQAVMAALREIKYDGYLTVEIFPPKTLPETALRCHAQTLDAILKL